MTRKLFIAFIGLIALPALAADITLTPNTTVPQDGDSTTILQLRSGAAIAQLLAKTPALGQQPMATSQPVTIASDQTAVPISAASLPLPTGASTSANQATLNTSAASIDTKTPALGQAAMAASQPVAIASDQPAGTSSVTLQNAATGTGNGTALTVTGFSAVMLQLTGTFSATVTFEGTVDGTNWATLTGFPHGVASGSSITPVQTTTTTGNIYRIPVSGLKQFRARISTYASGSVTVSAIAIADGAAFGGPVITGTTATPVDASPNSSFSPFANAASSTVSLQSIGYAYNGATWDRVRTPAVFKPFTISASAAETTVWTPTSGKKFRVMGWSIYSDTATPLTMRDNTAGTVIYRTGAPANGVVHPAQFGNGILSAAANNLLTLQCTNACTISGTVYGTEE